MMLRAQVPKGVLQIRGRHWKNPTGTGSSSLITELVEVLLRSLAK